MSSCFSHRVLSLADSTELRYEPLENDVFPSANMPKDAASSALCSSSLNIRMSMGLKRSSMKPIKLANEPRNTIVAKTATKKPLIQDSIFSLRRQHHGASLSCESDSAPPVPPQLYGVGTGKGNCYLCFTRRTAQPGYWQN